MVELNNLNNLSLLTSPEASYPERSKSLQQTMDAQLTAMAKELA
jgi:hypothetical protein